MLNINPHRHPRDIFSRPRRSADEQDVQNNLAYTPEEMMKMVQNGEPISPFNLTAVDLEDGYQRLDFDTPLEYTRGVDIGDCWEAEQRSKRSLKMAMEQGLFNVQNAVE